ncbi:APC family permease [Fluviispira multicolorata]|uniref:Amino acid permease n=1 Tax=Fluviispira multicolorata TaxID=2654512 RepID=A0A833JGM5_9BACT|nr:APC family permease [Fluviispira multicolorata]KAB8032247.1 amino acid permease [Fluviispira multicolorata]
MELKRGISTWGILFASVSATIGSGWLFGSLYTAKMAGPAAILAWFIGAVAIIIVAMCFAELSTMFPVSGGLSAFPLFTHGTTISFILGWVSWLAFIVIVPIEVLAVIQYGATFVPSLMQKVGTSDQLTPYGYIVAFFLTGILLLINITSARIMSKTSFYITIWKLLVPCLLIVLFLYKAHHFENLTSHGFAPSGMQGLFASLSVGGIILAYNGFQPGVALAGETKNPQRSIPIAIVGSMVICMFIYCFLQFAFILAVPPENLSQGWSMLSFAGEEGPFAGLAIIIGLAWFGIILYSDALISPFGSGVIFMAASARSSYSMSKSKLMPHFFQILSKNSVPLPGLVVTFILSLVIFVCFDDWQEMAAFYAAAICLCNAVIPVTLFIMRKDFPNLPRPFKIFSYKIISMLAFYISNMLFFWCGWHIIWKLDIVIGIGIIVLAGMKHFNKKSISIDLKSSIWLGFYLIAFNLISFLGTYGNGSLKFIPNGYDFVCIAIISYISVMLANKFKLDKNKAEKLIHETLHSIESEKKNQGI